MTSILPVDLFTSIFPLWMHFSLSFIVTEFPCASVLVGNIKLVQGGFKDATDVSSILCAAQLPLFIHLSCWLSRSALPSAVFSQGLTLH